MPPHILRHLAQHGADEERGRAVDTLMATERLRGERHAVADQRGGVPAGQKRRTLYDALHLQRLPGRLVRGESDAPVRDAAVNEAFDGLGATYDFYAEVLGRRSIDGRGERLDASVHFGRAYDNAFWNGREMVFGDGDGKLFQGFTRCLEVIGHELTHGVVEAEAALVYEGQPGALNESFADVLGVLVKQWKLGQTVAQASWLVGEGLLAPGVHGAALRSMKAPGTAYDDRRLGKDPQPATMKGYVETEDDNGGVHVNSGIPNHAFYLCAKAFGGHAWEKAGRVWYHALCHTLGRTSDFAGAAQATALSARALLGAEAEKIVKEAWRAVGVGAAAERAA
ncbi:M4 family metallopeptidase [Anaeromyxobacter diazotrophicus]|uniref:Neutral metalloproteinase n=1 Tax=Anaeromyxobacter diazotrophicus TaxID=2590199 RepID=A0A7I9VJ39_9BACT|nr:M4 family metallopeptidase [Anaeromyxobacter diazotrophicus]GEJ56140.1 metalloprotease [Anaeromyxobacter diazotrophicus]